MLDNNTWNRLTVHKSMRPGSFKNNVTYKLFTNKSYMCVLVYVYMYIYEQDLELNNLIYHKIKPNQTKRKGFNLMLIKGRLMQIKFDWFIKKQGFGQWQRRKLNGKHKTIWKEIFKSRWQLKFGIHSYQNTINK